MNQLLNQNKHCYLTIDIKHTERACASRLFLCSHGNKFDAGISWLHTLCGLLKPFSAMYVDLASSTVVLESHV